MSKEVIGLVECLDKALKGIKNNEIRSIGINIRKNGNYLEVVDVKSLRGFKRLEELINSTKFKDIASKYLAGRELNEYTSYIVLAKILEDYFNTRSYILNIYKIFNVKNYNELLVVIDSINKTSDKYNKLQKMYSALQKDNQAKEVINKNMLNSNKKKLDELEKENKILRDKVEYMAKEKTNMIHSHNDIVVKLKNELNNNIHNSRKIKDISKYRKHNYVEDEECIKQVKLLASVGLDQSAIADRLGLSVSTIYTIKNKYHIDIRRKDRIKEKVSIDEIKPLIDKGMTYKEIEAYMKQIGKKGYSIANICRIVRESKEK